MSKDTYCSECYKNISLVHSEQCQVCGNDVCSDCVTTSGVCDSCQKEDY